MAGDEDVKEFPDVSQKLAAPKKLSAFEKERQAAEAKRQRAEAENAEALKEFENSFADEHYEDSFSGGPRAPPTGPRGVGLGFGGRGGHGTTPSGPRSGPGSLGPIPGAPPPPPSLKRKRALDEMREVQEARMEQGLEDRRGEPSNSYAAREDEREDDVPMPTVQLSSLPPTIAADDIKLLLKDHLKVHSVRILPPSGPGSNNKRSLTAIATLSSDMPTAQVDTAVGALKDKYLGYGFCLSISRQLSSVAIHPTLTSSNAVASSEPFGAEKPRDPRISMRNAPPPMDQRGFAPPELYDSTARGPLGASGASARSDGSISVRPPLDLQTIKAVHTIVDHLLLEPDAERALETEAMLMCLPEVQRDERFAFLFDSRSAAGVYYRFCLWAPDDRDEAILEIKRRARGPERIHEDVAIDWVPPYTQMPFPDLKSLAEVVTHIDYISSDEESDDDDGERKFNGGREDEGPIEANEKKHLLPLQRARLIHLLSRLPTSNARLRKGDVARVTNFAISHAGAGAEEIVDLLVLNVESPLSSSLASKYEDEEPEQDEEDVYEPDEDLPNLDSPAPQIQSSRRDQKRDDDPSNAKLIALYLISDILSASSTAGARNAWKYRQLFESGFRSQKTFEKLGKLDKVFSWGRMKTEQWKRKVRVVLEIWESWSVFSSEVHDELMKCFFEPPLTEEERAVAEADKARDEKRKQEEKLLGKFKRVDHAGNSAGMGSPALVTPSTVREISAEIVDGTPMANDGGAVEMDDVDGAPMKEKPIDEHLDGSQPAELDGARDQTSFQIKKDAKVAFSMSSKTPAGGKVSKKSGPRSRMRAEDMFADSDEE